MYEHIIGEALRTPWALTRSYMAIVQRVLGQRASGATAVPDDLAQLRQARAAMEIQRQKDIRRVAKQLGAVVAMDDDEADPPPSQRMLVLRAGGSGGRASGPSIAVIPIYGVILHRSFDAISGATSAEMIGAMVDRAAEDDEIAGILLDVASPGGTVVGVPELAAQILAARKDKQVVSLVNGEMHSAGFWLGSQAEQIVSIPSGYMGSIGVWMLTEDWSQFLENEGIKINFIYSGDNKIEDSRFWEPLSDDTRAHLQAQSDAVYAQFIAAVAKGRQTSVADVKKNYGQGRVFDAKAALERNMIDRLGSLEDTLGSMLKAASRKKAGMAAAVEGPRMSLAEEPPTVTVAACATYTHIVRAADDPIEPDENGDCPDGYEKGDDGMCHMMAKPAAVSSDQAAADRDAIALALAQD